MYDIRSAMLNIGIVFTPGKFKINLEKTWKTPGILVNLRSTDPVHTVYNYVISFRYTPFYYTGANILSFEIDPPKKTYMAAILWA